MLSGSTPTEVLMGARWTIGRILDKEQELPAHVSTCLAPLGSELDTLLDRS
jgi:hypothetical protein